MTVSAELAAAVDIFTELGWRDTALTDIPALPLGTDDQRRTALAGLHSGNWGEFGQITDRTYGWISWIDVDDAALALFAIRLGVDARRAAQIMPSTHRLGDEPAADILAARGPEFARRFVDQVCVSSRRPWEHATSVHAGAAVRLVAHHRLPVPDNVEYLKDWAVYALGALTGDGELFPAGRGWIPDAVIADRYAEHARAAVAAGVPATGPFPATLSPAIDRGWIDRADVVDLAFAALDSAQRPGDRKAWLALLTGELAVDPAEFVVRADAMVSLMSFGDAAVVESLAPVLLAAVDEDVLVDVLTVALNVPTKKARRVVLTAAAARPGPGADTVAAVADLIVDCATGGDRALNRAATALMSAWSITAPEPDIAPPTVRGLWQPTPDVWQVPRFEPGDATVDTVADAAAHLLRRGDGVVDVAVERFLALANRLAHDDPDAARVALAGVRQNWIDGLIMIPFRLRGGHNPLGGGAVVWDMLRARERAVVERLGEVPVLLSTPSWDDLRIDPDDLLSRLEVYAQQGFVAAEADLFAALTRLDLGHVGDTHRARIRSLVDSPQTVPVQTMTDSQIGVAAEGVVAAYLDDPLLEPALVLDTERARWMPGEVHTPRSLSAFPRRMERYDHGYIDPAALPAWGDATGLSVGYRDSASAGLLLRQLARRATPLTPAVAVNMIAAQRGFHRDAAADGGTAVVEAWERGLLRPGVPDVRYLDWGARPSGLTALAGVGDDLVADGLLPVLWPVFDDLVAVATRESRIPQGTVDLVEFLDRWLPEARAGLDAGAADLDVLDLPGVRTLAARGGSSRAVAAARALVGELPPPTRAPVRAPVPREVLDFDEWWHGELGVAPVVDDGAEFTVTWVDASAPTKTLAVDLRLPDRPGDLFRVRKGWFYDLEHEGQCAAVLYAGGDLPDGDRSDRGRPRVWLRWDDTSQAMIVGDHRNWAEGTDGPLPGGGGGASPLTTSMVAVVLVGVCHDTPDLHSVVSLLRRGLVGAAAVSVVMPMLLGQPKVSPARLVRLLDSDPSLLPVLWPVLVESIRCAAGVDGAVPRWLNRVLDIALRYASLLREAGRRGVIPAGDAAWPGLAVLAERGGGSAAVTKAKALVSELTPP
ncbi:MAG: hypothetical protein GXY65_06025 [Rhodococcus sp.]|uniref:hypothetical protein n=1 Tax=Rhodococcus sp. TaxID=1831 RepID=UPI0016A50374|nr:hypothetical protein [Rhodococcus sp. (in: high G+C Gram-positive bacteria)]NLV78893.1 hypothetical protein [Rhodococcus sp. (in: high G+C Gram-positive bacteria)]